MVLKFEEFVNEGLWSKGFNRDKTGEERLEDKLPPIEKTCTIISKLISESENIQTNEEICRCLKIKPISNDITSYRVEFNLLKIGGWGFHVDVYIPNNEYEDIYNDLITVLENVDSFLQNYYRKRDAQKLKPLFKNLRDKINELYKKDNLTEGLWSKGFNRDKIGDVRQEEKDKIFYQPNVYPVTGFDGWFFELSYIGGRVKCIKVYKKPDEDYKFIYYGIKVKPNKRWMIVDKTNTGFNVPRDSDEYNLCKSKEFVDSINNDMDKFPVKSFKIEINEGLWSKGFNRDKTGEERLQDKIKSNIDELKIIDIGENPSIYFANEDLEIEGQTEFTYNEYLNYKDFIESKGWKVPTLSDLKMNEWDERVKITTEESDEGTTLCITSWKTDQTLLFFVDSELSYERYLYELSEDENNYIKKTSIGAWKVSMYHGICMLEYGSKTVKYKIRLVKPK